MNHAWTVTKRIAALGLQQDLSSTFLRSAGGRCSESLLTGSSRRIPSNSFQCIARLGGIPSPELSLGLNGDQTPQAPGRRLRGGVNGGSIYRVGSSANICSSIQTRFFASRTQETPNFGNLTEDEYRKHPYKPKLLSTAELRRIFGSGIQLANGNKYLQLVQKHRVTGTLDQEIILPGFTDIHLAKALAWLRTNYPLDEDAAIIRRIELEEAALEKNYVADVEKLRTYQPQASAQEHGVYGKSELDDLRAYNREKNKREEEAAAKAAQEKEAEEMRNAGPGSAMIQGPSGRAVLARRTEEPEWVKKYKEKAKLSKGLEPPEMSKLKRLMPSAIFTLVTLGACILFAQSYRPPPAEARIFQDLPPAAATMAGIIALNVTAFLMWRTPPLWRFMNKYFLVIAATPKAASMFGNIFSHQSFTHLLMNMGVLWFVGPKLHDQIGRGNFLAVYIGCGVFASFMSLNRFVLMRQLIQSSLGASGAILGIVACYLALNSRNKFSPAWWPFDGRAPEFSPTALLLCFAAMELLGIYRRTNRFDHYAHLAGLFSGIVSAEALKRRARLRSGGSVVPRRII